MIEFISYDPEIVKKITEEGRKQIRLVKEIMKNKIISIGYIGLRKCYLNVDREEAIKRYCKSENIKLIDFDEDIFEMEFDDEFEVYDIYES